MTLHIREPEVVSLTESSVTVAFGVEDDSGPVDARAVVKLNGEPVATSEGSTGTRLHRLEGLRPGTRQRIEIEAKGTEPVAPARYFPEEVETLAPTSAREIATFATLNDLHFGEGRFGGSLAGEGEFGDEAPGFPVARESDGDVPYWRLMNEDAVRDINAIADTSGFRFPLIVTQAFDDIYEREGYEHPIYSRDALVERIADLSREFDMPLLIEEFVRSRRLHAIVLGNRTLELLPLVETRNAHDPTSRTIALAQLGQDTADRVRQLARRAFRAMDCRS